MEMTNILFSTCRMDVQGKTVAEFAVYEDIIGKPALKQCETVNENNIYVCLFNPF